MRLLVVAFGTRGDVQPLLALSRTLRANFKITFCTHKAHRRLASTFDVDFVAVQSDPLRPDFTSETAVADEFEPVNILQLVHLRSLGGPVAQLSSWVRASQSVTDYDLVPSDIWTSATQRRTARAGFAGRAPAITQ